jgi:fructose-bisphosphate aldolase class I
MALTRAGELGFNGRRAGWSMAVAHRCDPRRQESVVNEQMLQKMRDGRGFIAALDQSGGSTPKALRLYGVEESEYSGDEQMFDLIHQMRTRIITSPSFNGRRVLGAILFEMTMDRQIEGVGSAEYLWNEKEVVPFLKVDKGLAGESDGVQVMKPIPDLDTQLGKAVAHGVFGTKMRSVIKLANEAGVASVVDQQFEIGSRILDAGLVPIIEPEVDIHSPEKAAAEQLLKARLTEHLDVLPADRSVMLKLTLPDEDDFYADLVAHPRIVRVVALSGGYRRDEANALLARNHGVIASFSRALTEGLTAQQSPQEFDAALDASIQGIYDASTT